MEAAISWIGRAMPRREDDRLLRGAGRYTGDLIRADALRMEVLRSPFPAGRIDVLDVTAARAMPGVVAVYTAADLDLAGTVGVNPILPDVPLVPMQVLPADRVGAVGQAVAAVVAESRAAALDALEAIDFEVTPDDRPVREPHRAAH